MAARTAKPVQRVRAALIHEGDVIQMQGKDYKSQWVRVERIKTSPRGKVLYFYGTDDDWSAYRAVRVNTLIGVRR